MINRPIYVVRPHHKVSKLKRWLMNQSTWYKYNIAWKQSIWVVYDLVNKKICLPGGTDWVNASNTQDRMEDLWRNLEL